MSKPARGSLASMAVPKAITPPPAQPKPTRPPRRLHRVTRHAKPPKPTAPVPRRVAGDLKTVQVRINKLGWRALRDLASVGQRHEPRGI